MLIKNQTADFKTLIAGFIDGKPITIHFAFPTRETLSTVNSFVAQALSSCDRIFLLESLITIIRECIFNASKANAKRLFFESSGKNINNPFVYDELIAEFKTRVIQNFPDMQQPLEASEFFAEFTVLRKTDGIQISVMNNVGLLPAETFRISERINGAAKYKDFNEVYEDMYDDTEGAGLGIILTSMILKNMGVDSNTFMVTSDGKATTASFFIPDLLRPHEISTRMKDQIIKQINVLPTFPNTIIELIHMCEDASATITQISDKIKIDPSLTADILKLANSAGYIAVRKVNNINDALVRIGLKNVKFMLIAASSRAILEKRFKKFESIWNHCLKTAIYARFLASELKLRSLEEQAFICGLLHDMGKIVLLAVDLNMTNRIAEVVEQHRIRTTTVIEEISIGISHSQIGKLLATKWNFSEFLIQGIEFHHSPHRAKMEHRTTTYLAYLANLFCGIESKKYEYSFADSLVCETFGLTSETALVDLHQKLIALHAAQDK